MRHFAQPLPLVGGINIRNDPRAVRDDQLTLAGNVYPDFNGILSKRPPLRFAFFSGGAGVQILNVARAAPGSGAAFIVVGRSYTGAGIFVSAIDESGTLISSYPSTISDSIPVDNPHPVILNYESDSLVFPGPGFDGVLVFRNGLWKVASYTIDVPLTQAQPQNAGTLSPLVAFTYRGRTVIANFGKVGDVDYGTSYSMSDYRLPATYDPPPPFFVPRFLFVGSEMLSFNAPHRATLRDEIEPIVAGIECMLQMVGSATQAAFIMFGRKYAYIGTGVLGASTETDPTKIEGDLEVKRVNYECGCISHLALLRSQFGVLWVGADDVWLMDVGGIPRRVGTNIRTAIQNCPPSLLGETWAVFADNMYKVAIPTQQSSATGPVFEHYWLDMRDGPPKSAEDAKWYGPMTYRHVSVDGVPLDDRLGVGVVDANGHVLIPCGMSDSSEFSTYAMFADVSAPDGTAYDCALPIAGDPLVFDPLSDYNVGDIVRPVDQYTSTHAENGHQYICTVAGNAGGAEPSWPSSGSVTVGTVTFTELLSCTGHLRRIPRSDIGTGSATPDRGFRTEVLMDVRSKEYAHQDGATNKSFGSLEVDFECDSPGKLALDIIQNQGATTEIESVLASTQANARAGSLRLNESIVSGEAHQRAIRPDQSNRVLFKRAIYKLYDDTSWVIDDSNDTIWFIGKEEEFTTTVTRGAYATMKDLCVAVKDAIVAVLQARGNTVTYSYIERQGTIGQPYLIFLQLQNGSGGPAPDDNVSLIFNDPSAPAANQALQKRCANLFAMMGFDTSRDIGGGIEGTQPIYDGGTTGIIKTIASKCVPERNCQPWRLIEANAFGRVWGGRPFSKSDRTTGDES